MRGLPEPAEQQIAYRVAELRDAVDRQRFAGDDPIVEIDATNSLVESIARVIAALRTNAQIKVRGELINPHEDSAADSLARAIVAIRGWSFAQARGLLESAAIRTRNPVLSQRIELWRALVAVPRWIVFSEITSTPRADPTVALSETIDTFDLLPDAERKHYRGEVIRLGVLRREAISDNYLQTVWCLLRSRLTTAGGDPTLGLAWLLRAHSLNVAQLTASDHLSALIDASQQWVASLIKGTPDGTLGDESDEQPVRTVEVFNALAAHLNRLTGRDVVRESAAFNITSFQEPF